MKSQGYRVAYDFPYSYNTTSIELNSIKLQCSTETILCAGGAAKGSDNLLLVSCGDCQTVLTETPLNTPVLNNGAYWYLTTGKSFGFSPNGNIKQLNADWYDCEYINNSVKNCKENSRLSWHLTDNLGGWRIGKLTGSELGWYSNHRKLIFLLNK